MATKPPKICTYIQLNEWYEKGKRDGTNKARQAILNALGIETLEDNLRHLENRVDDLEHDKENKYRYGYSLV